MFSWRSRTGWDALPEALLQAIKERLGDNFTHLDQLADSYGLFRQRYFKRPPRRFQDVELEVGAFAFLVGSLGNQLAQRGKLADAQKAFETSLVLKPNENPIAFSLANLHAMQGDLDAALPAARIALKNLWADHELRTSIEGRKMHVMLGRMLVDAEVRNILGQMLFDMVRDSLEMSKEPWSEEQRDNTVYALLEIGGPEHDVALRESLFLTEDVWFDAAVRILREQFDIARNFRGGFLEGRFQELQSSLVYSRLIPLVIACTRLNPNHIDAWVLAARVRQMGVNAGMGFEEQAFEFALEALERIDRFLKGDNDLRTRDQDLHPNGDPAITRGPLLQILRDAQSAATEAQRDRASSYLL